MRRVSPELNPPTFRCSQSIICVPVPARVSRRRRGSFSPLRTACFCVPGMSLSSPRVRVSKEFIVPRFRNDSVERALKRVRERVVGASDDERRGRVLAKRVQRADGGAAHRVANRVLDFIRNSVGDRILLPDATPKSSFASSRPLHRTRTRCLASVRDRTRQRFDVR